MAYDGRVQLVTFVSLALFLLVGARQVLDGHADDRRVRRLQRPRRAGQRADRDAALALGRAAAVADPARPAERRARAGARAGRPRGACCRCGRSKGGSASRTSASATAAPTSPPILEGISLDVPAGTTVAIVGRSGSGKTTLIKCLAGLLEPTEGAILYDGLDLRTLDYRDAAPPDRLRPPGEPPLRRHDRAQHRASARTSPTRSACGRRRAWPHAHEFVERLPLGYETRVGESGLRSRAASSSGSRSRAPSTTGRRCCSSTRRRARSTPSPSARSRRTSTSCSRAARRS